MYATAKEIKALGPADKATAARRALGVFTQEEKDKLQYIRRVRALGDAILTDRTPLTACPDWLKYEDYKYLLKIQRKHEKFKNYRRK